jgi:hypothetical protein
MRPLLASTVDLMCFPSSLFNVIPIIQSYCLLMLSKIGYQIQLKCQPRWEHVYSMDFLHLLLHHLQDFLLQDLNELIILKTLAMLSLGMAAGLIDATLLCSQTLSCSDCSAIFFTKNSSR